ncbi:MAG: hypothetical protein JWL59_1493 [Chthoniobacteraceae bacterium]|nr:hypothetical protein [Chthoniobacteraceae bacterium]
MQTLAPIPIPFHERWREIRLRSLPIIAFALAIICIVFLWRSALTPATLVGQVEQITSSVNSPVAGVITELNVTKYQVVKKGTPIGIIVPNDPRIALDLIRVNLENQRAQMDPGLGEREYDVKLNRLRVPVLQQKVSLATTESNLAFAKLQTARDEALLKQHAITQQAYEVTLDKERSLQAGIIEQKKAIADLEAEVKRLESQPDAKEQVNPFAEMLREQEKKLIQLSDSLGPVTIVAPIDGMVTMISRRAGENVALGEWILVLSALHTDTVIGYLRDPFPIEPIVGMDVEIRTRGYARKACMAKISRVGTAFEDILNPHLHPNSVLVENGLPIAVALPASLNLQPGTLVDMLLIKK